MTALEKQEHYLNLEGFIFGVQTCRQCENVARIACFPDEDPAKIPCPMCATFNGDFVKSPMCTNIQTI